MFKLTSRFVFFRRVSLTAVQNRSFMTTPHLQILQLDTRNFHPKKFEYYMNSELSKRLSSIPYLDILQCGADTVSKDIILHDDKELAGVMQRVKKVFDYIVVHNNTLLLSQLLLQWFCTYRFGMKDTNWNDWDSDEYKKAALLAWCFEMFMGFTIVVDDLIDQPDTRRGHTCWYKLPDVGLQAILDCHLLQCASFKMLEKYFGNSKCYNNLLEEFLKASENIAFGQSIDIVYNSSNLRPELFTFERYNTLVEYKTIRPFVGQLINLALHFAEGYSESDFDFGAQLATKIGMVIQLVHDYKNCYGQTNVTDDDIQRGKLTWFAVKFLEEASDSEKAEFLESYGVDDETSISKVRMLYNRYSLKEKLLLTFDQLASEVQDIIEPKRDWLGGVYALVFSEMRAVPVV